MLCPIRVEEGNVGYTNRNLYLDLVILIVLELVMIFAAFKLGQEWGCTYGDCRIRQDSEAHSHPTTGKGA